ncbi:hypothetical protein [Aeromonas veronii]|uniref:hypothetical protein n=1 Tax=Aeromonas veronii TaxID=654 RepID=UPI003D1A441C
MNQPLHSLPFAMNRVMSKPWPTRTACKAELAHYGVTIQLRIPAKLNSHSGQREHPDP